MPASRPLRPDDPIEIGANKLVGCLSSGGQGLVYLGVAPSGKPVAVKMLHSQLSRDPKTRERFLREIAPTRQVQQFCTARVLAVDTTGDQPYVVSEHLRGLASLIAEEGPRGPMASGAAGDRHRPRLPRQTVRTCQL